MARPAKLISDGERRIIDLASQGKTDKEICDELGVAMTTVRTHWQRVRKKMNAVNRAQAIAQFVQIEAAQAVKITRAREAALSALLNQLGAGIWEWRPSGTMKVDPMMREIFGVSNDLDHVDQLEILRRLPNEDRRRLLSALHQAAWGQESVEVDVHVAEPVTRTLRLHLSGTRGENDPLVIGLTTTVDAVESTLSRILMA